MKTFPHPIGSFEIEHGPTGVKYDVVIRQSVDDLEVGSITIQENVTLITVLHQRIELPWYAAMSLPVPESSDGLREQSDAAGYSLSNFGERWLSVALRAVEDYSMGLRGMTYDEIAP